MKLMLMDADDTLWENNVYFERAIERYHQMLARSGLDRATIRARINQEERRTIAEMGYGLKSFMLALTRTYHALLQSSGQAPEADAAERIAALAEAIAAEPIELLPDAEETLRYLAPRYRLVLFTKGDYAEQTRKVELSGVGHYFAHIEVVAEKNVRVYRRQLERWQASPPSAWMVGNSPRSDINPALAAGMNAVFILHPQTWILEHDEIAPAPPERLLRLDRLADLRRHF